MKKNSKKIVFGLDLGGFRKCNSALAMAVRSEEGQITVTIFRSHPFSGARNSWETLPNEEVEFLTWLNQEDNSAALFVDCPIDLQTLLCQLDLRGPGKCVEELSFIWELTHRPIDKAFGGLAPIASNLGFLVARFLRVLKQSRTQGLVGEKVFETYPRAALEVFMNSRNPPAYKSGKAKERAKKRKKIQKTLKLHLDGNAVLSENRLDAVICALVGLCERENQLERKMRRKLTAIAGKIRRQRLERMKPPEGYVLPAGEINQKKIKVEFCKFSYDNFPNDKSNPNKKNKKQEGK